MTVNSGYGSLPGITAAQTTTEKIIWWGREELVLYAGNPVIGSAAVDAGNTPTTDLRAGLLLGKRTSDGKLYAWDPDATDGTEVVESVLLRDISMLDPVTNAVADRMGHVIAGGPVKASELLIQGTALTSHAAEHLARGQMVGSGRFIFDDKLPGESAFLGGPVRNLTVTGDTTVTASQNGTRFVATAADCDFTLPTLEAGLSYEFLRASDHEMSIISAAGDDMIVGNDLSADSVTFTTSGEQIGARAKVESIYVGTTLKWLVTIQSSPFGTNSGTGLTMAIAT